MTTNIRTTMLLVFCLIFCGQTALAQTDDVLAALKGYDDAWNAKNVKAASEFMHENYVYFNSLGGVPRSKGTTLEFLGRPDYKLSFVERSELQVIRSANTAVVSSRWKGKGTWSGGEINDDQRCGLVFVREKKAWKLLSEHCVQIAAK